MASSKLVAEHCEIDFYFILRRRKISLQSTMKVDFDMIFRLNAAQKLVAEHCVSDFYMIFHLKAAQHLVAEHYMKEISTWFSTSWRLRNWLQSIMNEILT